MNGSQETFLASFQTAIGKIFQVSMRGFWKYTKAQGLSMPQMFTLRYLYHKGESNVTDIGRELGVTSAAASQMLDRLVQQDLVSRRENPHDRRNKQVTLTDRGRRIIQGSTAARRQWLDDLAKNLTPEEMVEIAATLDLLARRMTELSERNSVAD